MPKALAIQDNDPWLDDAFQLVLACTPQPAPRPWLPPRHPATVRYSARAEATVLELAPLAAHDARTLALAAAGDTALSQAELAALTERAAGNALFIRELAVAPTGDDALPETVELLLTNRIDTLQPAHRMLLRHASAPRPSFDLDLLTENLVDEEAPDPKKRSSLSRTSSSGKGRCDSVSP